jgi:hypothetical protein
MTTAMSVRMTGSAGSRSPSYPVGRVRLTEPRTFRKTYETASWHRDVQCPLQEALLWCNGYYLHATFAGTVTDEHFVNRLGASSAVCEKTGLGKPDRYGVHWYAGQVARGDMGDGYAIEWFDGYGCDDGGMVMPASGHRLQVVARYADRWSRGGSEVLPFTVRWDGRELGSVEVNRVSTYNGDFTTAALRAAADRFADQF